MFPSANLPLAEFKKILICSPRMSPIIISSLLSSFVSAIAIESRFASLYPYFFTMEKFGDDSNEIQNLLLLFSSVVFANGEVKHVKLSKNY